MNAFSYRVGALQPSAIREILKFTADPEVISFAAGNPAPEAFPTEEIARITNEILTTTPIDALQYSITEGYTPLRNWIKDDLKKKGMFVTCFLAIVDTKNKSITYSKRLSSK